MIDDPVKYLRENKKFFASLRDRREKTRAERIVRRYNGDPAFFVGDSKESERKKVLMYVAKSANEKQKKIVAS